VRVVSLADSRLQFRCNFLQIGSAMIVFNQCSGNGGSSNRQDSMTSPNRWGEKP
jgi:hypothetical protein